MPALILHVWTAVHTVTALSIFGAPSTAAAHRLTLRPTYEQTAIFLIRNYSCINNLKQDFFAK